MTTPLGILALVALSVILISLSLHTVGVGGKSIGWLPMRSGCHGTLADCLSSGEELGLDSESNRRILATSSYISYGALQRNNVPCSQRGASYYICKQGAQANPYNRGCAAITRCRT